MLGIAGPPGAGKSALAAVLEHGVNRARGPGFCVAVPMDGFHRSNEELDALGLRRVKGAPETFDVAGFVRLLGRARDERRRTVRWPGFDRGREEIVPGAIAIAPATRLVVVEGNYLLLGGPDWGNVRRLLDEAWYVEPPAGVLRERLLERARAGGRTEVEAIAHVDGSDLPNARLVATTRALADRVLPGL